MLYVDSGAGGFPSQMHIIYISLHVIISETKYKKSQLMSVIQVWPVVIVCHQLNTMGTEQNGWHYADNIFKCIL